MFAIPFLHKIMNYLPVGNEPDFKAIFWLALYQLGFTDGFAELNSRYPTMNIHQKEALINAYGKIWTITTTELTKNQLQSMPRDARARIAQLMRTFPDHTTFYPPGRPPVRMETHWRSRAEEVERYNALDH